MEYQDKVNAAFANDDRNVLIETSPSSQRIKQQIKQQRRKHLEDISTGEISPQQTVAYLAALNACARVRDHAGNIAEAISGEK